jgi:hypothetical protein
LPKAVAVDPPFSESINAWPFLLCQNPMVAVSPESRVRCCKQSRCWVESHSTTRFSSNRRHSGSPTVSGTFTYTVTITDRAGNTGTLQCSVTVGPLPCSLGLSPLSYNVSESSTNVGEIVWFNSHLVKLSGTIPTSSFTIYVQNGQITFGTQTLTVPNAAINFSSSASCASTTFNTTSNTWVTTLPLSSAGSADEILAAGLAYPLPAGFAQNVDDIAARHGQTAGQTGSREGIGPARAAASCQGNRDDRDTLVRGNRDATGGDGRRDGDGAADGTRCHGSRGSATRTNTGERSGGVNGQTITRTVRNHEYRRRSGVGCRRKQEGKEDER